MIGHQARPIQILSNNNNSFTLVVELQIFFVVFLFYVDQLHQ